MALAPPWTLAQVRAEIFTRCTLNTGGDRGSRAQNLIDSCIKRANLAERLSPKHGREVSTGRSEGWKPCRKRHLFRCETTLQVLSTTIGVRA